MVVINRENHEFLIITHKHVSGHMVILNLPTTPKLWAHENGNKAQKQRVFGHNSQTCISSYGCCNLPANPITVRNIS